MSTEVCKFQTLKPDQTYESESETETEPMREIVKFKTLKHRQKYEYNSVGIVKFQSLMLDQTYRVQNYTKLYEGEYPYRILQVSEDESDETFELFTTPLLLRYIKQEKPKKFSFTVREKSKIKYPFIEGYNQERKWVLSE